jgi:hypothetical protein
MAKSSLLSLASSSVDEIKVVVGRVTDRSTKSSTTLQTLEIVDEEPNLGKITGKRSGFTLKKKKADVKEEMDAVVDEAAPKKTWWKKV